MVQSRAPERDGVVVLRPDGIVESAHGGAPVEWIGQRLLSLLDPESPEWAAVKRLWTDTSPADHVAITRLTTLNGAPASLLVTLVSGIPLRPALNRVDQLVMRVADLFINQARHARVELDVHIAPDLPPVSLFDDEKIAWALSTLVGNAIRHVAWMRETDKDPLVRMSVHFRTEDESFVFRVSDNGPGIPDQDARWLFERNPATGKAAGLALVMIRDVMLAHRGSASVESTSGHGARFTLILPKR